jgi:hypothetical protein
MGARLVGMKLIAAIATFLCLQSQALAEESPAASTACATWAATVAGIRAKARQWCPRPPESACQLSVASFAPLRLPVDLAFAGMSPAPYSSRAAK